jgi:hypothetical protein
MCFFGEVSCSKNNGRFTAIYQDIKTKLSAFVNSFHVIKYTGGHVVILLWAIGVENDWHDRFSLLKRPVDIYLQTITSI